MKVLLVKASNCRDVRLQKYIKTLGRDKETTIMSFLGWYRTSESDSYAELLNQRHYLLRGFSENTSLIVVGNIIWLFRSFLWICRNGNKFDCIYCADFEGALPVWLSRMFGCRTPFIYDVYDEFSLRYKMPKQLARIINFIEARLRRSAKLVIHVDNSRKSELDSGANVMVIENSPLDFFKGKYISPQFNLSSPEFAVTGYLTDRRGMNAIAQYVKDNPSYRFFIAGRFKDPKLKEKFMSFPNVEMTEFMMQEDLFDRIKSCNGIFSLYDPVVEINIRAASNKLYDAMMLGLPVITNREIDASKFVENKSIGITIPYEYDKKVWGEKIDLLLDSEILLSCGVNGRSLFEKDYNFPKKARRAFEL